MSDQHPDNEETHAVLHWWKVGEVQLSGDIPPPSKEFDEWIRKLVANDKTAAKTFGEYEIRSYWTDSTGKVLHLVLKHSTP